MTDGALRTSERCLLVMIACAFGCILISLALGGLAALYYMPEFADKMRLAGVSLVQLRPLHTTFASAWLFLGAATVVYKFLFETFGEPTRGDVRRFRHGA